MRIHPAENRFENNQSHEAIEHPFEEAQYGQQQQVLRHQAQFQREIDGMRLKRRESEVMLESIIAALQNTLEFVREQDIREGRFLQHLRPTA